MPAAMVSSVRDDIVGVAEDTMVIWPGNRPVTGCSDLRPVIWAHGHGGEENGPDHLRGDCRLLVAEGMVLLAGDFGGTSTWGNDAAINGVASTLAHARANGWCSNDPVVTLGFSMGTLTSMAWGRVNMADWAGHVSVAGAYDLAALHAGSYTTQINAAYGGSYSEATYGAEHNPVTFAPEVSSKPVVAYYSSTDALIVPAVHDEAFATSHGNTTRIATPDANHGGVAYVNPVGYLRDAVAMLGV